MQEERMHEREHMILSFVEDEHYRPMKIKEMAALMNVPKKQRGEFHEVLDRLKKQDELLNRVHTYLGDLIKDSLVEDTPRASDLADDVWDAIHRGDSKWRELHVFPKRRK